MLLPSNSSRLEPALRVLRQASRAGGIITSGVGVVVLVAWAIGQGQLSSVVPSFATMKPNTALAFVLAGASLTQWHAAEQGMSSRRRNSRLLATAVGLIGALTLLEYFVDWNLGIDELLFRDTRTPTGIPPGRMAPATAAHFVLLAGSLALLDGRPKSRKASTAEWCALLLVLSSLLALIGYLYGVRSLYQIGVFSSVALPTAATFFLMGLAILCACPERGIMQFVTADGPGGVLSRRLLPMALVAPVTLGWLRLQGERAGVYDLQVGVALFAASNVVCFVAVTHWSARTLDRSDRVRRHAELRVRESEENLAITLHSIGDAVLATDADGRVTRMNPVAEALTGWSLGEAAGKNLSEIFRIYREETREVVESPVARVLRERAVVGLANHTVLISRDGTERSIADSGAPIRDAQGAIRGVVLVFRDLTQKREADLALARSDMQRKQTEDVLERTERQLRHAQKMEAIGRLAGGIAHDFNNILSVIIGHGEFLLEDLRADDPAREEVQAIARAAHAAARLTHQLLAFSRQQVLAPSLVDLNETIRRLGGMLRRLIGEDIELVLQPNAQGKVHVDPGQLEQVLMNLAVNARDAMPNGGTLTIETRDALLDDGYVIEHPEIAAGPYVMLSVSDTGHGMDSAVQARIFEPFFTTKERGKGTGLGLATVFGIVRQSQGSIWVYSEPGKGTTFKVYLPRVSASEHSNAPVPGSSGLDGDETVLLVEDDEQVRRIALRFLERHGYRVLEAASGQDAIALCQEFQGPIHAVVTDVVMPKMSGPELAERLAQLRPTARVLFMSGYTNDAIVHHGALDPGLHFIQKPLTREAFISKLREVLDQRKPS